MLVQTTPPAAAPDADDGGLFSLSGPVPPTSLGEMLRAIPPDEYQRLLDKGKIAASRHHGYFPNEIRPAIQFLADVRAGAQKILVASPMQSGKTSIMACIIVLARTLLPSTNGQHRVRGVYICANNQIDFRRQAIRTLGHHMAVLTLSDRRKWEDVSDVPLIVFFDESHFGDGDSMTISDFLSRHQVFDTSRHLVFCGVSATPFSHMGHLDADIFPDLNLLEEMNYNSVGMMLERGRIIEADPLFVDENGNRLKGRAANDPDQINLNEEANVYRHIERIMQAGDDVSGYGIIRCSKVQASFLTEHLERVYGHRVMVVNWNQHCRDMNPTEFFSDSRYSRFTVCLVQHKARMGNQINTEHCHFMYETSPSGNVDTISQSFIGRACGFGKQEHKAIIYSHVVIAEIYDALMGREPNMDRFAELCSLYRKRPGLRAELSTRPVGFEIKHIETITFPRTKDVGKVIRRNVIALQKRHADLIRHGQGTVRRLSKWDTKNLNALGPRVRSMSGSWSIGVFDREPKTGPDGKIRWMPNDIIKICLHVRSKRRSFRIERAVGPKFNSLYKPLAGEQRMVREGLRTGSESQRQLSGTTP